MSRLWMAPSALVAALMVLGPLGAFTGLLEPGRGFGMFFAGAVIALVSAIGLGGAAAIGTLRGSGWRPLALRGALVPVLAAALVLLLGRGAPSLPFNDVTTDLVDPPIFATGPSAGEGYPDAFLEWHREAYADLEPLRTPLAPPQAYARALEVARAMERWQVVREDPQAGVIEAVATTRIFRFEDDVAIRVRSDPDGARLDVRSRSRLGQGDLGANRARIGAYFAAFGSS